MTPQAGDDWNPLLWNTEEDAKNAAVKAYSKWTHADADENYDQVAKLIRFSDPSSSMSDIHLHFYNLVDTLRNGGEYQQWATESALTFSSSSDNS